LSKTAPVSLHPPIVGSPCKPLAPIVVEALNQGNPIFRLFERRLLAFLKDHGPDEGQSRLCGDEKVFFHSHLYSYLFIKFIYTFSQVHPYQQVKVAYTCRSSLLVKETIIRCHPKFHGRTRNDVVLVTLPDGRHVFARLHFVFTCEAFNRDWQLSLVTLFKTAITPEDSRIGMRKILEEEKTSAFIDVGWIRRSVYAVPDFNDIQGKFFTIVDVVDADMYLRLHNLNII
jgi:hypothetical protein